MDRVLHRGFTIAALAVLCGCANAGSVKKTEAAGARVDAQAQEYLQQMRAPVGEGASRETVRISSDPWVDRTPIRSAARRLPADLSCIVAFKPLIPVSLLEIAQQLSHDCGVPIRVTSDALAAIGGGRPGQDDGTAGNEQAGGLPMPGIRLPALPAGNTGRLASASLGLGEKAPAGTLSDVDYKGPLEGLLDLVAARTGLSWKYNEEQKAISIFHLDTRTFTLDAFAVEASMASSIQSGNQAQSSGSGGGVVGGGAGGGGGGGLTMTAGSSNTTNINMRTSLYQDVESTVKALLTPNIGRMSISQSTGDVVVTDTPEVLDRVSEVMARLNRKLGQPIILHTKILAIDVSNNQSYGINWNLLYETLSGKYGFSFSSAVAPAAGAGTLGASVVGPSPMNGSSVVLQALSRLGNTRTVYSPSVMALNMQPTPVQIAKQIGYISSTVIGQTQGAGTTTGLLPGFVTVGFNMNLTPRLVDGSDDDLLLNYSFNISSLLQLRSESAGGTKIEFPDTDIRNFNGQVRLRSGETLILHGFEQESMTTNRSGMFSPFAWLLGGEARATRGRQAIVVLITPEVMRVPPVAATTRQSGR